MEHAIRRELHVKLDENPILYATLRERLERIIADRKVKRIDAAKQLELPHVLTKEMKGAAQAAEILGPSETPRLVGPNISTDRDFPSASP
jgi:type I restriction enzyme R subunit